MMIKLFALAAAAAATTADAATNVFIKNSCDFVVELWDNVATVNVPPGGTHDRHLPDGYKNMFRHGKDPRATLGEVTVNSKSQDLDFVWFDISIIPTNVNGRGPDYCVGLEGCKRHTLGGYGFNVPMQIAPRPGPNQANMNTCRTLTCMHDGCDDAYQWPKDDTKTHSCAYGTDFDIVFCPGGNGGATTAPPTPEPTTPAPTNATEERSIDDLLGAGVVDTGKSAPAEEEAVLDTPAPTTPAPTAVEIGTTAPPAVEANTQSESGGSSPVGTVFIVLGAVAAVAGAVMIVVIRRKKAALDAWTMDDKNSIALRTSTAAL